MQIIYRVSLIVLLFAICMLPPLAKAETVMPKHAVAMHGEPKYKEGFTAFDYVNPEALKGGTLRQGAIGTFDTFNPFALNGIAPGGIGLTYDTLMVQSLDESFSLYGLVADKIEMPHDRSWVAFHINTSAKFSDGTPITADDVIFSFETLRDKGLSTYRYYYNDVETVEKTSESRVVFRFKKNISNRELPLILGELPILSKKFWMGKDFSKTILTPPVSGGPYKIKSFEPGRSITYERDENYWAKDLNVNKGLYNFDTVKYDYYRDATVATEAFKAGDIDIRIENEAKKWVSFAKEDAVKDGKIKMANFYHELPSGMQGFVFNLRRPIFADPKVREALNYVFDFNWTNTNLFHGLYKRTTSFFDNSPLKAPPLPAKQELKLLNSLKNQLPPQVFTQEFKLPDTQNMRVNYAKALSLLGKAGWRVHQDGILRNEKGEPFEFEILLDAASASAWERITLPFIGQLKRLGIRAKVNVVDVIQYKNRMDNFDYDMIVAVWGQSLSPGNEQRYFWGSEAADSQGSSNYAGLKSPAVDALIEKVIAADSNEELLTAVHALDRVLLWQYLIIPHWHTPMHRVLYWDKFDMPSARPTKGINFMSWWMKQ